MLGPRNPVFIYLLEHPFFFCEKIQRIIQARRPRISPLSEIRLSKMQGKVHLVKPERVRAAVRILSNPEEAAQLARLYVDFGLWSKAIRTYCEAIARMVEDGSLFSTAYYAKELAEQKLYNHLFEAELRLREERGDLWWQVRCLQELGWSTELVALMKSKGAEIEASGNYSLLAE